MKYLLILLFSLCANCFPCFAQQTLSNPLYLGPILLDKPSIEAMAKLCEQYKLTEVPSDDDSRAFKHDDGTLIKFTIISDSTGNKHPYVEIHTNESKKNIEKFLDSTGFHKGKNRYEKGYYGARRFTTCRITGSKNMQVIYYKEKGRGY